MGGYRCQRCGHGSDQPQCPRCRSGSFEILTDQPPAAFRPRWVAGPAPGYAMWMDAPYSYSGALPIADPRVVEGVPYVPEPYDGVSAPGITPLDREHALGGADLVRPGESFVAWCRRRELLRIAGAEEAVAMAPLPPPVRRYTGWRARVWRFANWLINRRPQSGQRGESVGQIIVGDGQQPSRIQQLVMDLHRSDQEENVRRLQAVIDEMVAAAAADALQKAEETIAELRQAVSAQFTALELARQLAEDQQQHIGALETKVAEVNAVVDSPVITEGTTQPEGDPDPPAPPADVEKAPEPPVVP